MLYHLSYCRLMDLRYKGSAFYFFKQMFMTFFSVALIG